MRYISNSNSSIGYIFLVDQKNEHPTCSVPTYRATKTANTNRRLSVRPFLFLLMIILKVPKTLIEIMFILVLFRTE